MIDQPEEKMKNLMIVFCALLLLSCGRSAGTKLTAFHPGEIWPDNNGVHINAHGGGILDYNGKYYWFGEHKVAGKKGNKAWEGVHCYSSKDLTNWKDEGIVLSVVKDNPDHPITAGCVLERPKVIYNRKTGFFVMWFHLEFKGTGYKTARSGVAMSRKVTGPYEFQTSYRPNAGIWPKNMSDELKQIPEGTGDMEFTGGSLPDNADKLNIFARDFKDGQMARDQTVFVDDDGTAYHLFASEENSTLHISKLTDDYIAPAGEYIRVFPGRFMEAPAIFKHKGLYYFIGSGCTGWAPNAARSAVAESIWGPWKELGNPCSGENAELTFHSQSTYILPVRGRDGAFIFLADRWKPDNAIDGRYIWLPLKFHDGKIVLEWKDEWDLGIFD